MSEREELETARTIYVQWSDDGRHIRKWDWTAFDLAERVKAETTPVSDMEVAHRLIDAYNRGNDDGLKTAKSRLQDKDDEIAWLRSALVKAREAERG